MAHDVRRDIFREIRRPRRPRELLHYATATAPAPPSSGCDDFLIPGDYVFDVPDGVFVVDLHTWGAGAGAGLATVSSSAGGGGGGGYARASISVVPGQELFVRVGAGGIVNVAGGDSSVWSDDWDTGTLQARGDGGSPGVGKTGGVGGGGTGDTAFAGGDGGNGSETGGYEYGAVGGGGGDGGAGAGGAGADGSNNVGDTGGAAGAGGAADAGESPSDNGGGAGSAGGDAGSHPSASGTQEGGGAGGSGSGPTGTNPEVGGDGRVTICWVTADPGAFIPPRRPLPAREQPRPMPRRAFAPYLTPSGDAPTPGVQQTIVAAQRRRDERRPHPRRRPETPRTETVDPGELSPALPQFDVARRQLAAIAGRRPIPRPHPPLPWQIRTETADTPPTGPILIDVRPKPARRPRRPDSRRVPAPPIVSTPDTRRAPAWIRARQNVANRLIEVRKRRPAFQPQIVPALDQSVPVPLLTPATRRIATLRGVRARSQQLILISTAERSNPPTHYRGSQGVWRRLPARPRNLATWAIWPALFRDTHPPLPGDRPRPRRPERRQPPRPRFVPSAVASERVQQIIPPARRWRRDEPPRPSRLQIIPKIIPAAPPEIPTALLPRARAYARERGAPRRIWRYWQPTLVSAIEAVALHVERRPVPHRQIRRAGPRTRAPLIIMPPAAPESLAWLPARRVSRGSPDLAMRRRRPLVKIPDSRGPVTPGSFEPLLALDATRRQRSTWRIRRHDYRARPALLFAFSPTVQPANLRAGFTTTLDARPTTITLKPRPTTTSLDERPTTTHADPE